MFRKGDVKMEKVIDDTNIEFDDSFDIENLSMFTFHEATQEEIELRRKKRAEELEKKGFLPENEDYSETMTSPQEMVEQNPTRFIIQECLPACLELWKKNIYTFMVSDHLNEGECWIEVAADSLSDENMDVYMNFSPDEVVKFSYHPGGINFGVNCVGVEGQRKLLALAKEFHMQDVPEGLAYYTPQDFLMKCCGCYEEYPNPNYQPMQTPWELGLPLEELSEALQKYDEWKLSDASVETLRKFAPEKVIKPISEYAQERGMIVDGDRIYLSEFHYQKHQNYVNYQRATDASYTSGGCSKR